MAELREFLDPSTVAQLESLQVVARRVVEGFLRGAHPSPAKGSSMEFAEHRPYVPGDDLRHLDWRGYARTDRWFLRQYEDETNLRAILCVDLSRSMDFGTTGVRKARYASCLAAALGWLLLGQRDAVGLAVVDSGLRDYLPPKATAEHFHGLLSRLDSAECGDGTRLGPALHRLSERVHRRSLVAVLSDLIDDPHEALDGLTHLRRRGCDVMVFQILDPAELELPFDGWTVFRDSEDPSTELRLDVREVREIYRANLERHQETLRKGCAAAGIDRVPLDTRVPFEVALGRFLDGRARRR